MTQQEEFQKRIVSRAIKDEKFREELKKNPKMVIERELGHIFPKDIQFNVIEQDEKTFNIILPKIPNAENLSEEELKKIAGGGFIQSFAPCTGLISCP